MNKKNKLKVEYLVTVNSLLLFQILFMIMFVMFLVEYWKHGMGLNIIFGLIGYGFSLRMYKLRLFYKESLVTSTQQAMDYLLMKGVSRGVRRKIGSRLSHLLKKDKNKG